MGLRKMYHDEGKREGIVLVFRQLLAQKFGAIPDWAVDRLDHADQNDLEKWAAHILEANTLEEVFEG